MKIVELSVSGVYYLNKTNFHKYFLARGYSKYKINSQEQGTHRKRIRRSLRPSVLLICLNNETSPGGRWERETYSYHVEGKRKSMHISSDSPDELRLETEAKSQRHQSRQHRRQDTIHHLVLLIN